MKKRTLISATTAVVLALSGALVMAPAASADDAVAEETVEVVETTTEATPVVEEVPPAPAEPVAEPAAPAEAPATPEPVAEPVSEPVAAPAPAPAAPEAQKVVLSTPQTQPDMICTESGAGWGTKVDTTGDPATVTVTADAGFLIDSYCVKAGTTKHIVPVNPASASVVIDHPEKDSVSHYQVHQVAIPVDEEPVPTCQENLFEGFEDRGGLWEVTYGTQHTDTNGVATFTNDSFGGLVAFNEGPIPAYMTGAEYRWLYVYGDEPGRTWTWDFADGTRVTAVASYTDSGCPVIEWTTGTTPEEPTFLPSCTTVTGEQTIVGDGVLTVAGDWATDVIEVPFTGTLADIGTVLDIQADPIQYVGLHIDTAEGTIVFEEEPSYGGNLWSETAWDGVEAGLGYAAFGSIEEFITLNGDVEVLGIRLLYTHPNVSTTTVTSFTIGCTVYTFEPEVVTPEPTIVTPESPTFVDTCVAGDAHWTWTDTDAYYYEEQTLVDGAIAVTAIAREGYAFPEDAETVWVAMEETAPCPIDEPEVPGEEPTDGEPSGDPADTADFGDRTTNRGLAVTGGDMSPLVPISGGLILLIGAIALAMARRTRTN